jgi:hypothetical protein
MLTNCVEHIGRSANEFNTYVSTLLRLHLCWSCKIAIW